MEGLFIDFVKEVSTCVDFQELADLHAKHLENLQKEDPEIAKEMTATYNGIVLSRSLVLLGRQ